MLNRLLIGLILVCPLGAQLSDAEREEFLLSAKVVDVADIAVGSTQPVRATLRGEDGVTHDAHVQRIDERAAAKQLQTGTQIGFRDFWGFNIAAYKLDRLLDLNMLPTSVERKFRGASGAYSWWIDDVKMSERERWEKKIEPPSLDEWNKQMYRARVFNQLTYNTDPNLGNLLIDENWKLWLLDYTRAFRIQTDLLDDRGLIQIDRDLLEALRTLDEESLEQALGKWVNRRERRALLKRRDKMVEHFEEKIAKEGEAAVLYD